ncbi:hypothetical protein Loa_01332 [Legionella oakridgensis ATCC 33761 = DSM 21215]|uniref:Uncharacterized protein n=1 Tax=Legionella oakridgensis ATCC 33761 = DSM 21215 TaxID=1268635 RepID=W0BAM1_9GAMM|nr:hypothetical protein Loa_01332 [Legionella oakridgensis ATCC 33761 = DSM 21215]STY19993.1 Uncharacterised protein [Legionella longbeachae]
MCWPLSDTAALYSTYDLDSLKKIKLFKEVRNEKKFKHFFVKQFLKQKPQLSKDCNQLLKRESTSDILY